MNKLPVTSMPKWVTESQAQGLMINEWQIFSGMEVVQENLQFFQQNYKENFGKSYGK